MYVNPLSRHSLPNRFRPGAVLRIMDSDRTFLVVVDMQNDFIDGPLGTPEAAAIVPCVIDRIVSFEGTVVCTLDTHGDDYHETREGRMLPVPHCIRGTPGWSMPDPVEAALTA